MSSPIDNATVVIGSVRSSGEVQTGEVRTTRGGGRGFTRLSGIIGGDVLIYSGGGRLSSILVCNNLQSGQGIIFYDSAIATSGGPFAVSGHNVVGIIPPIWREGASGVINPWSTPGQPQQVDMPFKSGLCAAAVASGTPGFAISFTTESNILDGGPIIGG